MNVEEKYNKAGIDYYVSVFWRKLINSFLAYPEFIFLGKIIIGIFLAFFLFVLFRRLAGV